MKEAMYYKEDENKRVRCQLCPRKCVIAPGKRGDCRVRENQDGKLISLVYGKPCAVSIDPIEKKPLFHFLPGTTSYSIGTAGCNLHCLFCQNWTTAQVPPESVMNYALEPKEIVRRAKQNNCKSISYTYNEPTVFFEYVLDTAKIAKKAGIKNIMVTNGYINKEPAKELYQYIDAANVDLKGFTEDYYRKMCFGELKPVLETLKLLKEMNVWVEVTNLIIPTLNDDFNKIKEMCKWIKDNLGSDVPLHFSRFFPCYKLENLSITPEETLLKAKKIAEEAGLKYVYVGNIMTVKGENSYCQKCRKLLIERTGFSVIQNNIKNSSCKFCNEKIAGVFS